MLGDWWITGVSPQEVVIGHRRVATARKAGLKTIAVRLRDLDDWAAVEYFVDDHIPIPGANEDGLYSQQEIEQVAALVGELHGKC